MDKNCYLVLFILVSPGLRDPGSGPGLFLPFRDVRLHLIVWSNRKHVSVPSSWQSFTNTRHFLSYRSAAYANEVTQGGSLGLFRMGVINKTYFISRGLELSATQPLGREKGWRSSSIMQLMTSSIMSM